MRIGHNRTAFQCNANPFKPKLRRIRTPANRKQDLVRRNENSLALLLIAHAGFRNFRYPRAKQKAHAPFFIALLQKRRKLGIVFARDMV